MRLAGQVSAPKGLGGFRWLRVVALGLFLASASCGLLQPTPAPGILSNGPREPGSDAAAIASEDGGVLSPTGNPKQFPALTRGATPVAVSTTRSASPPQYSQLGSPFPASQARMVRGYCTAMYALEVGGLVDIHELQALDTAAMRAKDLGDYDNELDLNKQAYRVAHRLLEASFEQNLARAPANLRPRLEETAREFRRSMKSRDLFDASYRYGRLLDELKQDSH